MKLTVVSRSGKQLAQLELNADPNAATVGDLRAAMHAKVGRFSPARQWWTYAGRVDKTTGKPVVLSGDSSLLSEYGIEDGAQITLKDLGPQISWTTVFLVEYLGPLLIHPLFFSFPGFFFCRWLLENVSGLSSAEAQAAQKMVETRGHSTVQVITLAMVMFHFVKRELETLFVHRFSHGTMPMFNLFKNSVHYWLLSGALLAYDVYSPAFTVRTMNEALGTYHFSLIALFLWAELSNFHTHWTLRQLRPLNSTVRKIPRGYGFDAPFHLSCPNYFFESVAWLAVAALARSWGAAVFLIVAVGQMAVWAVKKHRAYKKEFKAYPKGRSAMFPFVL